MEPFLLAILGNDNAMRADAEKRFAELKKTYPRDILSQLSEVLRSSTNESFRSLSAILLRGIAVHEPLMWGCLSSEEFDLFRNQLLESLMKEEVPHLQRTIANTVATHAKLSAWPALMQGILQLSSSANIKHHELCLFLIDKLAENVGPLLVSNLQVIMNVILPFLDEKNGLQVRGLAAQALCSILFEVTEVTPALCKALVPVPSIIMQAVKEGEDIMLQDVLSSVSRLSKQKPAFFKEAWLTLFQAIQHICDNIVEGGCQVMALTIMVKLIDHSSSDFCSTETTRKECLHLIMRLLTAVDEDDNSITSPTRPASEESGFGDVDGDGGDGNISDFAALCLDELSKRFDGEEILSVCMTAAWSLIAQDDWRARRAALLIISIIIEGANEELYEQLIVIVPMVLTRITDPHPRVRFIALICIDNLISNYAGKDDLDEDENNMSQGEDEDRWKQSEEEEQKRFQKLFSQVPTNLLLSAQANSEYPRIVYASICALVSYFNPDSCDAVYCEPYGEGILSFCVGCYQNIDVPMFVRAECSSLIGNVSLLYYERITLEQYKIIMESFQKVIFNPSECVNMMQGSEQSSEEFTVMKHELSLFRGKSLEGSALIGKAMGKEVFLPTAILYLNLFMETYQRGLDFSDPLSSHIVQACARIAGIIGDDFKPYVDLCIPPLLASIAKGINVQVSEEDSCFAPQGAGAQSGANGGKEADVFTVYQRGVGNVQVIFNTHEITEREMGCRCLYQYITDIHKHLWPHSLSIIRAVCPLLSSTVHKSEDLFVCAGAIIVEALTMFLFYSPSSYLTPPYTPSMLPCAPSSSSSSSATDASMRMRCAGEIACIEAVREIMVTSLTHLKKALQQLEYCITDTTAATSPDICLATAISTTIHDLLVARLHIMSTISHANKWEHCIPSHLMFEIIILARDICVMFIQKRYVDRITTEESDEEINEDQLYYYLMEVQIIFVKLFKEEAKDFIVAEIMPFIEGFVSNYENPESLMQNIMLLLTAIVENIPSIAAEASVPLVPCLLHYIRKGDVMQHCVRALGSCAVYGGPIFDKHCGQAITLLLCLNESDNPAEELIKEEMDLNIRDLAIHANSALFKIAVFRGYAMQGTGTMLLKNILEQMPIQFDLIESKIVHKLFVNLLEQRDLRLLGPTTKLECLPKVLTLLSYLVEVIYPENLNSKIQDAINFIKDDAEEDFWGREFVDMHTLLTARNVLKEAFAPGGIPSNILEPVMKKLDKWVTEPLLKYSK